MKRSILALMITLMTAQANASLNCLVSQMSLADTREVQLETSEEMQYVLKGVNYDIMSFYKEVGKISFMILNKENYGDYTMINAEVSNDRVSIFDSLRSIALRCVYK